jgi:peptidyl-prolyl cis-trans isomerase SurA
VSKMHKSLLWLTLAATLPLGAAPPALGATQLVERIIARVNNNIITQLQYDREREKLHSQLAQNSSGDELEKQFRKDSKDLLRDMIDQDLLVQKAKDDGISVETDIIKRLDEIRQQYNLPSLEALQETVEKQGLIWEDFKDQIRRQLLMRQVISQEVGSRIILSRADARKYFEAHKAQFDSPPGVHLAEILVSTEKHKPAEAKELAQKALAEIQNGAHFSSVAQKDSDAPSASEGGDVGFFKAGTIAPTIASAISKVDVGETTGLIETQYGYMIFKVLERRTGKTPTFDQVDQQVSSFLYNQKINEQLRTYLTTLRKESYIRLAPGFVDSGTPTGGDENY